MQEPGLVEGWMLILLCSLSLDIKQDFRFGKEMWYFKIVWNGRYWKNNLKIMNHLVCINRMALSKINRNIIQLIYVSKYNDRVETQLLCAYWTDMFWQYWNEKAEAIILHFYPLHFHRKLSIPFKYSYLSEGGFCSICNPNWKNNLKTLIGY